MIGPMRWDRGLVQRMRVAAEGDIQVDPEGSAARTWGDVLRAAVPHAEEIRRSDAHAVVTMRGFLVSITLSLDVIGGGEPRWHLSMARMIMGMPPQRVPDVVAGILAAAFETPEEGPAEGALEHVRHFRGPYGSLQ